jgi:hypothetical protein
MTAVLLRVVPRDEVLTADTLEREFSWWQVAWPGRPCTGKGVRTYPAQAQIEQPCTHTRQQQKITRKIYRPVHRPQTRGSHTRGDHAASSNYFSCARDLSANHRTEQTPLFAGIVNPTIRADRAVSMAVPTHPCFARCAHLANSLRHDVPPLTLQTPRWNMQVARSR